MTQPPQSTIAQHTEHLLRTLPEGVQLVAVSKFHPAQAILRAYDAGARHFGESRAQELAAKAPVLPPDIRWHFIGHLQTNKVRTVIPLAHLIESVDSPRLLQAIDREALAQGITARVLLQVHVAAEETKFGFTPTEILEYFSSRAFESLQATHICGIMAMASNTADTLRITSDFNRAAEIFRTIRRTTPDLRGFDTLSMGMSHDYPLAITAGANSVRIGSYIFGDRIP